MSNQEIFTTGLAIGLLSGSLMMITLFYLVENTICN